VSGSGFSNPLVGGGGALVYPQIKSPNFNIANPAASPSPSWAILKSGLAYFFGLALSGGTISGPDYVINTAGIFIYSGTPATGNLIGSWTGTSGTDAFGNLYPAGFNITTGAISGSTFSGADFIINAAGIFIYSGPPSGPTGGSLTETPVTPEVSSAAGGVASSTHAFSPAAGSMAVVTVSWLFASNATASITCKDSLGNSYAAGPQEQDAFGIGIAAVFTHTYAVAPGPVTVTVTCSNHGAANAVIAPRVLSGQAASQAGAATVAVNGTSKAVQGTIPTTVPGSLVYLAADTENVVSLTAIAGTTTILADPDPTAGDTGITGRTTAATVTPGPTAIGWTSPSAVSWGLAALEILPSAGGGNLIGSWAGAAGTDPFGNTYPQGLSVDIGAISGAAITGSSFAGNDFILNSSGLFLYSSTPALGNLVTSITQAAGTDGFGNVYAAGITFYASGTAYTALTASIDGNLTLTPSASGTGGGIELPALTGTPASAGSIFYSANGVASWRNNTSGFNGQLVNSASDISNHAATGTGNAQITNAWNIPANDMQVNTVYRLESNGVGLWGTAETLLVVGNLNGSNQTGGGSVGRLASGFLASATPFCWDAIYEIICLTTGTGGTCRVKLTFHITAQATAITPGTAADNAVTVVTGPQAGAIAINTTIVNSMGLGAAWGGTTGGPTISSAWSTLKRIA
jgi:hypothetical protein